MSPDTIEILATVLFGIAVLHTFSVKQFQSLALKYPQGSIGENLFHLLGEVEIVFGLWAGVLILALSLITGGHHSIEYIESLNFTEPVFVFVIMSVASTRPVIFFAKSMIAGIARVFPMKREMAFYFSAMVLGPLLGSFITEPAAMTVTAFILKERFFDRGVDSRFMYLSLGTLFVNVSIGGVLTNFAAPPVLMVAQTWSWDIGFMMTHFGWKAALAVVINAAIATAFGARVFTYLEGLDKTASPVKTIVHPPVWLIAIHLLFLGFVVSMAHHPVVFLGAFLFFLGIAQITSEYQDSIKLKDSLLVGFFLGGLVILGSFQSWWLKPLLESLGETSLFLGTTTLTALTDNAALTYLGSQVPGLSDGMKYALVAGAVAGGGLTVIANAPNPAGFSILRSSFGEEGISPVALLAGALVPTLIAMACLWLLPYSW